ncbi:hypothetical protein J7J62_03980 [bacterium]|nr:hypothetical protein [bacterium]
MNITKKELRKAVINSSWDFPSVIAELERQGIPPEKVIRAIKWCAFFKVPAEKLAGYLVCIFGLLGIK